MNRITSAESRDQKITILLKLKEHLNWWMKKENLDAFKPLNKTIPEIKLFTDVSSKGWVCHLEIKNKIYSSIKFQRNKSSLVSVRSLPTSFNHQKDNSLFQQYNYFGLFLEPRESLFRRSSFPLNSNLIICFQNWIDLIIHHIPEKLNVGTYYCYISLFSPFLEGKFNLSGSSVVFFFNLVSEACVLVKRCLG